MIEQRNENNVINGGSDTADFALLYEQVEQLQRENKALKRKCYVFENTIHSIEQSYDYQKKIYERIKEDKKQQDVYLQLVFEYTPEIILIIDRDYKIINATKNSLRRLGVFIEDDSLAERRLADVFSGFAAEEQNERVGVIIREVMKEGMIRKFNEIKLKFVDTIYVFEICVVPLKDESGEIIGVMLNLHDITGFRHALDSAERASKAKDSFLAKVSHEIRTPMNAIIGLSELILRDEISKESREHVSGIKHAGNHLVSIINDILDFSKIESGMMEITPVGYSLSAMLNYAIGIIRMRVIDEPILFVADVEPDIPEYLFGDEIRMKQMILNLLTNACKYCEKGFIKFKVDYRVAEDDAIILNMEVADSGIGIKEENIGKLFGDFIQIGEAVGNKGVEGTGLGLAITRGFAQAMGGDVSVESVYGEGSVFRLCVPQRVDMSHTDVFAWVHDPNISVLIYETREIYAESLADSMRSLGVKYTLVTDQTMFFEEVGANVYDFVFVSDFSYDGTKKAFRELKQNDFLMVLVAEYGSLIIDNEYTKTLTMPAHTADIAYILNYKFKDGDSDNKQGLRFVATSASVLIVDDINTNLVVAQGLMALYKMNIDLAKSGKEAIELVKENHYDIVFMDHMMPEMDGIEAAAKIRSLDSDKFGERHFKKLPLVALTANAVSGMREMFINNGFDDFLAKPIDINLLAGILEKWLPDDKIEIIMTEQNETSVDKPAFRIEGVDVESGIYMTGGDAGNYLKTLSIFRDDGIEKVEVLRECSAHEDLHLYATHVHALKSALASIGAAKISNLARLLESAAKNNDRAFIDKNNERFLEELIMLLESIKIAVASVAVPKKKSGGDVDLQYISEQALLLKDALDSLDMEKVDAILANIGAKSDEETDKVIEEISNCILICEYVKAEELIGQLIDL
ncbi:MAG: ATP-binding protein [Oscillospiraceae bacterium]|nr:ATP-binding protein [Oscillospiraceae bacterium]